MKGIDIFCASQAATSICLSMEEASSSSTIQLGGGSRLIDRYNPIIRDSRRSGGSSSGRLLPPCSSQQPPISPKPKNTSSNQKSTSSKPSKETKKKVQDVVKKRNSSWSCTKPGDFITPPGSTRYLLSEKDMLEYGLNESNNEAALKLVPAASSSSSSTVVVNSSKSCPEATVKVVADNESNNPPKPTPSSSSSLLEDQVVVLRVSLHCRGCEKKMRKHLSRMQGVTSFNIDFAAKKVTVTGDVTPLAVLASISKVKNAQLWPPTLAAPSIIPSPSLINSELKNSMTTQQQVVSHGKLEYLSRNISPASLEAIGKIVSV